MTSPALLTRAEGIIDASGVPARIEALLPAGVRHRQLSVRTLLLGMLLTLADRRPAYLTETHAALTALPGADQARLGVMQDWKTGPHQLTYRQVERTFGLVADALAKDDPDGAPADVLARICDDLLEASIPARHKNTSTALAVDWTDMETFSRPPHRGTKECADPEASWGHRNSNLPGPKGELFFGYFLSAATMAREEQGPAVPELARRMTLTSCHLDPARALGRASHFPDCGSFRVSSGKDGITWQENTGNSLLSSVKKRPVWSWKLQGRSWRLPANSGLTRPR
jgi:hypothetical protein